MGEIARVGPLHFKKMEKCSVDVVYKVTCLSGENPFSFVKIILVEKETKM